jgi:hypothetical protein
MTRTNATTPLSRPPRRTAGLYPPPRSEPAPGANLLTALAEVGVEPGDYALIEQAKTLVDEVNTRLRARGSEMVYSVTFCVTPASAAS